MPVGRHVERGRLGWRRVHDHEVAKVPQHLPGHVTEVLSLLHQPVDDLEHAQCITDGDGVAQFELDVGSRRPNERRNRLLSDLAPPEDHGLVQERERIANRSLALSGERLGGPASEHHALLLRDVLEVVRNGVGRDAPEIEALAPADDRGRHLVRLGGGKDEPHPYGRLLEDLQQGIEGFAGEPLSLIDDVDLLTALRRRGGCAFAQLASVVHAPV